MGANLNRVRFSDWVQTLFGGREREVFLAALQQHLGKTISVSDWNIEVDDAYPRIGSYGTYDVFRHSLYYVHAGNFDHEFYDASDLEPTAKKAFEEQLRRAPDGIPYAAAILDAGDTDTLFIPLLFENPLEYGDEENAVFVTSLPGAMKALEGFARAVGFDLSAEPEPEFVSDDWQPLATCRNVARIIYQFFAEEPDANVELG